MGKNNETTTKFKVDISDLKASMQEARKQVAYANSEFKAASSAMDDWSKSSDGLSAKLKQLNSNLNSQEAVLSEYEKILESVKKQYGDNSKEALEYATRLNNQQAAVNKIKKEIRDYEKALEDLSDAGKETTDDIEQMGKRADEAGEGFTILKGAVADFVGNALTEMVSMLQEGIRALVTFGDQADSAMNSFQASTGASTTQMEEFEDVMENLYRSNYGESFDDIAEAMAEIKRISGDIGADELEEMTRNALVLRDTFDFDVTESMRAVNSLMDQFGITSTEAFNLMAQGAQNGLNQNGDLLDVINEYSVHFKDLGMGAEDMFNILHAGAEEGVFSIDKMGDAMKEFGIRVKDGSDTTTEAFQTLGLNADEMQEAFAKGGTEAEAAYQQVLQSLGQVDDQVTKNSIGVGLFGTMWEDLGGTAIQSAMGMSDAFDGTINTMNEINSVKYDSVGEALGGIGRILETDLLLPISEGILPAISEAAAAFNEWLNNPETQAAIKDLTDKVTELVEDGLEAVKTMFQWMMDNSDAVIAGLAGIAAGFVAFNVASTIMSVVNAFKAFKAANEGATIAQWLLNAAMNANPIILLVTIIAAVVTALVTFIATNEDARKKIGEVWENITQGISDFVDNVKVFFTETVPEFIQGLIDWVQENWESILTFFINPFAGLFQYFYDNNEKFREFVDGAIEQIKELPGKVWEWLTNTIAKVTEWMEEMKEKARETGEKFIEKIVEFFSTLPGKVWEWLTNTIARVKEWIEEMTAKAKEAGEEFVNKVKENVSQLADKFKEWLDKVIEKIKEWLEDIKENAKQAGEKFNENVIEPIKELPGKIWEWLEQSIEKVAGWATDIGNKAKEAGKELIEKITEEVKSLPDKLKEIGNDLVDGLWSGVSDKASWLKDKISGFVGDVTGWIKKFFDINSPSGVMEEEVGVWLPAGIASGIKKNAKTAVNAMKSVSAEITQAAGAGIANSTAVTAPTTSVTNNFTQHNYSPKPLSRLEIYRQSKNLLDMKGT